MARHAAAAEMAEINLQAVRRETARATAPLLAAAGEARADGDALLAAVACCECVDRTDRRALSRSRAFHRAHDRLRDLQQARRQRDDAQPAVPVFPFRDESDCERYLAERFRTGQRCCPDCGGRHGNYLPSRRAWECAHCHRQSGLRSGTVMARSGLPLLAWFRAIAAVLARPTVATAELADELGIRREATVRQLARRIREALLAEDASERLAGLDRCLLAGSAQPERSALGTKKRSRTTESTSVTSTRDATR